MVVTLDLAPSPASVREARRFAVDTLREWGRDDLTTTAALLVTELVTNAVLHAKTVVRLCLRRSEDSVRVEVRDGSAARPALRHHGLEATTGRGLALVARLASSWGVDVDGTGKIVWAYLLAEDDVDSAAWFAGAPAVDEAMGSGDPEGHTSPGDGKALATSASLLELCA